MAYKGMRKELNCLAAELLLEKSSFMTTWRTLGEYITPFRPRFTITDVNQGHRRTNNILDCTATEAAETLQAGLMSGVTSPSRKWFRLTTADPQLAEVGAVKKWLHSTTERMFAIYARSNFYEVVKNLYLDLGVFGTAGMLMLEDFTGDVIHCEQLPIGSFAISTNEKGRVDTCYREFTMTVRQLISKYGYDGMGPRREQDIVWERFSQHVKSLWDQGNKEARIDVCHIIRPNPQYDEKRLGSKYKRYASTYWEKGGYGGGNEPQPDSDVFLRESGYDHFPGLFPRWSVTGEDTYATNCPGIKVLGDVKGLQVLTKKLGKAVDKQVDPPMVGPPQFRRVPISLLPGGMTVATERDGQKGLRPIHEVSIDISGVMELISAHQKRIKPGFREDVILMISSDERLQRATAEEIHESRSEKMIMVGPVIEQLNPDLLDPANDICFRHALEQGEFEEPPEEIKGALLKIEYVSAMAWAQRLNNLSGMERWMGGVIKMAGETQMPELFDKANFDAYLEEHGDILGVSPKIVRSQDEVEVIRQGRAKAAQAQQEMEMIQAGAGVAKDLSGAQLDGNNALSQIVQPQAAAS
jgi:hypothetical protein